MNNTTLLLGNQIVIMKALRVLLEDLLTPEDYAPLDRQPIVDLIGDVSERINRSQNDSRPIR